LRSQKSGAEPGSLVEESGVGGAVDGQAGVEADQAGDELGVATDEAELTAELLFPLSRCTPSPLRCGRLAYKPWRIIRIWVLPSIKFVFLKDLSLNSSSDWG
jgi:hypothetical protein